MNIAIDRPGVYKISMTRMFLTDELANIKVFSRWT